MADGGTATKNTRRKSREGRFSDATVASYYGDRRFSVNETSKVSGGEESGTERGGNGTSSFLVAIHLP